MMIIKIRRSDSVFQQLFWKFRGIVSYFIFVEIPQQRLMKSILKHSVKSRNPKDSGDAFFIKTKMENTRKTMKSGSNAIKLTGVHSENQRHTHFEQNPLISIVIPLYCTPTPYLKELIDSVRAQSYTNWQLCLADGSPDQKVEEYIQKRYGKDSRILYKHLEENGGISINTNKAIEMATGEYLMLSVTTIRWNRMRYMKSSKPSMTIRGRRLFIQMKTS